MLTFILIIHFLNFKKDIEIEDEEIFDFVVESKDLSKNFLSSKLNVMEYFHFLKKLAGKRNLQKCEKEQFIDQIFKTLKKIWSNAKIPIIPKAEIKKKIRTCIKKYESFGSFKSYYKNNIEWINKK